MTMTVTLVSGAYPDNRQHAGIYTGAAAQTFYFNSLNKITRECKTVPLGADIYFSGTIEELRGRDYGWIDYGDGFRYYFSIYDFDFVSTETTRILYKIDVYETYLFHGLRFGRAALERAPQDIGRPMMAIGSDHTWVASIQPWEGFHVGVTGWSSENNISMNTVQSPFRNTQATYQTTVWLTGHAHTLLYDNLQEGWCRTQSDMVSQKVFPRWFDLENMRWDPGYKRTRYNEGIFARTQAMLEIPDTDGENSTTMGNPMRWPLAVPLQNTILSNTRTYYDVIRDMRGNIIYKPDFGHTVVLDSVWMMQSVSNSSEILYAYDQRSPGQDRRRSIAIPIPGEPLDQIIESWAEYFYRQREFDMEARQLENDRQLIGNLMNTGQSAIGGAQAGGLSGAAGGQGIGAVQGAIVQIAGSVANYALNETVFDPREQQIRDEQMKKAVDTVNYGGSAEIQMTSYSDPYERGNYNLQGIYRYYYNTADLITEDIRINGYPVDYRGDMPQISEGAWKGQVEVLDLPGAWRDQVMQRFMGGVVIGRLG